MPKLLIIDALKLSIRKKKYALLRCKIFSLKIWKCKNLDKYHVFVEDFIVKPLKVKNDNTHKLFDSCEPK